MERQSRQPELITSQRRPEALLLKIIALIAALALPSAPVCAGDPLPALRPYTAHYQTTARGFDLDITRKLEVDGSNQFILTNGGKMLVAGFHEISVFKIENNEVLPISYVYQGTGLVNRRQELHFYSEENLITSLYKGKSYQLPYTDPTLDRMNQLEQLRLRLLHHPAAARDLTLRVADGKRLKDSRLVLIGSEILTTPMGSVDTLHYRRLHDDENRSSDLWFAPEWDYLMVKTIHVEDGDPVEMMLTGATVEGQPLGTP